MQNAAARLVFELGTREHVTASLLQLHWLPVRWRDQFKLCCLMHSIFHGRCPDYLSNIVRPVDLSRSRAGLRSSSTNFAMPQLRTNCGERAFSHAGPAAWNALPEDIRVVSDSVVSRKRLKTHFLWSPYVIGQTIIFLPCDFYLLLFFFPRLISAAASWMSTIL